MATPNSNPNKTIKRIEGIIATIAINKLLENAPYRPKDKMYANIFPAIILAPKRIPKETALAKQDILSIKTNNGTKGKGVPPGTKKENHLILWIERPKKVTPKKIVTLINIVKMTLVNIEKEQGMFPIKLAMKMKENRDKIKGIYCVCASPI